MLGNTIIRGGTIVFAERFDPAAMLGMIAKERITAIGGVPVMLQMVFDHEDFQRTDRSSLRMIGWGGAPASRSLAQRMLETGAHLFTNYGLTEGGAVVSATPPNYDLDLLCDTVGVPHGHNEERLVGEDGRDVAPGESGEIWLRGRGVFLGYWNNPVATSAAMTPDGWLRTGDIALARPDGAWELKGRKVEMFKSGGFNVYPREIELAIEEYPGVSVAAVVPVRDAIYFEIGVAFVAAKPGSRLTDTEIRDHLRRQIANYKVPKSIQIREMLPVLPIGKVDKQALRREAAELRLTAPPTDQS
jgi:acyl-CoA synthetase (AMP-forming)/AMP-acid ligase II